MIALKVVLLGEFVARANEKQLIVESSKVQELLAYLVLNRERTHHRSALAQRLWLNNDNARRYLRQAVWGLRTALRRIDEPALLIAEDEARIRLAEDVELWTDVHEIRALVDRKEQNRLRPRDEELEEALALYRGDLLPGNDASWIVSERRNAQALFFEISSELTENLIAGNRPARARAVATRALSFDPVHEATHRLLMRVHLLCGDRTAALRQYETCKGLLQREFGVDPERETVALHLQIQGGSWLNSAERGEGGSPPARALVSGLRD